MALRVNLLTTSKLRERRRAKEHWRRSLVSLAVLAVFLLFVVGITLFSLLLKSRMEKVTARVAMVEDRLKQLSPVEQKYAYLKSKAKTLVAILEQTEKQQKIARFILELFPAEVPIGDFQIGSDWTVRVDGSTESFTILRRVLQKVITEPPETPKIRKAVLESLSRNEKGVYTFSLYLEFD